jgi:catecholate siderophore receptor
MMAAYNLNKKTSIRLNVKNLTNKLYYDALYDNGGFAVPSNRRSATVSVDYIF